MGNRALLVGINAYDSQPLTGCVNDINDMALLLTQQFGFGVADIRLLTDQRATRSAIMDHLGWLLAGVELGDRIHFHYSGHGTTFAPRNAQGEVTGMYDSLVPIDFDWSPEHAITSVDLDQIFAAVPQGVEFVFVCDACNSGDIVEANGMQSRVLQPPADIAWRIRTATAKNMTSRAVSQENCALIAACASDQQAWNGSIDGALPHGALTYYLIQRLKGPSGLTTSLSELIVQLQNDLANNGFATQTPQLKGPPDLLARPFLKV